MAKYNRSKTIRESFEAGLTVEQAIEKCLQSGDKEGGYLVDLPWFVKRIFSRMEKATAKVG